jgi:REP element-mobilizing transposase RayT
MDHKYFYNRKLPHWQPPEQTFFITYRLAGSLPVSVINSLKQNYTDERNRPENHSPEKKELLREAYFLGFENELEKNLNEPHWLKDERIAPVIMDSLLFNDNKQYRLWCACLMSNHAHIMLSTLPGSPLLNVILQNHKKFTARQSNIILGRSGPFWAEESFDTMIRDNAHFYRTVNYCIQNPVKAGLVRQWFEWKWTYIHPDLENEYSLNTPAQ